MIPRASLDGLPLFDGLNAGALAALSQRGIEKRYATRQVLFRANDAAKGLFVVREGSVRIVRQVVTRGQVVHVEKAGGTLGEIPLFTGAPYPATATAEGPTRCLIFTADTVHAAIAADPELALRLLSGLAHRVRGLIARLDRLSFSSVRSRLAAFIIERAAASLGGVVSLGMTQTQLAEELGTVREVVVRELAALRRTGAIRPRGAGRIEVVDAAALAAEATSGGSSSGPSRGRGGAARGAGPRSAGR